MTGKKETGTTWHHTTVVLRSDIYRQALALGIDISDACNRALAGLTGSEYNQQREEVSAPPPVIIAKDGASPHIQGEIKISPALKLHPVINADDPAAPATVVQAKTPVKKAPPEPPAPVPAPAPATPKEKPAPDPVPTVKKAAARKDQDTAVKKRAKGDALKKFFSVKITRTDDAGDTMGKDELYELFIRFCHDHRVTPVPERKTVTVALKNQFALTEKIVNGTACWTGIRLK
jgi:outer membrane biosynthesis protein TonB